jgi:hypothetical protein
MHRSLFMSNQDVTKTRSCMEGVVQRQYRAAGIAEDSVDSKLEQGIYQRLCAIG